MLLPLEDWYFVLEVPQPPAHLHPRRADVRPIRKVILRTSRGTTQADSDYV